MKKNITPYRLKILFAVILLSCLALPFSSCSRDFDEDGKLIFLSKKPVVKTVTEYRYPFQIFNPRLFSSWLFIYSFLWPVPILLYRYRNRQKKIMTILWISEPVFVLITSYILILESIFSTPAIGQNLALAANGGYGLTWIYELIQKIIKFFKTRSERQISQT